MGARVKVVCANPAGACYGVVRALELTSKAIDSEQNVSTFGEIIHNPIVVNDFSSRGVSVIKSPAEACGTVVLRSHGVKPSVEREIEKHAKVIDATCPYVKKAQLSAKNLGERHELVIVIGEEGHPEVEAIVEYAKQGATKVVLAPDVDNLPDSYPHSVGIVSQTTQSEETFSKIVREVKKRMNGEQKQLFSPEGSQNLEIKNTICNATKERQEAALDLSAKANVMIVLGGKKSANTRRLFELCQEKCKHCFHIESMVEFDALVDYIRKILCENFDSEFLIGITAGASTPASQIDELESFLDKKFVAS